MSIIQKLARASINNFKIGRKENIKIIRILKNSQSKNVWGNTPNHMTFKTWHSTRSKMPSKEQLDAWKDLFAEGYAAGVHNASPPSRLKWTIFGIGLGIFFGIFIPFIIFTSSISEDRRKKYAAINAETVRTTFEEVKGAVEAKKELRTIVAFLKTPTKFSALGAKLPRGVLLIGPPGNGKTMLARALAGEAGVPFFHISGPEFEEMFVGEGARRVRELFKKAKKHSPCVIFIDEVDSVGSKRSNSPYHPYSSQTLNQLLTEMDGFSKNEGIIVLAATNRKKALDKALLRPGRFDVEITVPQPTYIERIEIFEHYLAKIVIEEVDVELLARSSVGFSGADIENLINRAAVKAAADDAKTVSLQHLLNERDRHIMGSDAKIRLLDDNENNITAHHEGGHCVVAYFTPFSQPLHKVTIIPRGQSLGHTAYLPDKDEVNITKAQILARLDCLVAGRAAEELIFGSDYVTAGAADDLEKANELAMAMVTRLGMSEKMGLRSIKISETSTNSLAVESEIQRILQESYDRAKATLKEHIRELNLIAEALLKHETLDASEIKRIMDSK